MSQFKQIQFLDDTCGVLPSHFPITKQSRRRCFIFKAARLSVDTRDCEWALCFYLYIAVQWPQPLVKMRKIRRNVLCLLSDCIPSAAYHCFSIVFCICRRAFPLPVGLRRFESVSSHFAAHKAMPQAEEDSGSCPCQAFLLCLLGY